MMHSESRLIRRSMLLVLLASICLLSGCMSTRVIGIEAHDTSPALHLESQLWYGKNLLGVVLWNCVDQGTQIVCTPECSTKSSAEMRCPATSSVFVAD